ncbi:hypothetical protein ANAEL_04073 [Anaerolineales bacterium]|nr:hypothetical protein ANAEL_04073 [Anaerolineales bacterium]
MAKGGRRYPLVVYTHMINRWWPAIFTLGLALLALAWALRTWGFEEWRWFATAGVAGFNVFVGILLLILRKSAYVQPFSDHLRLATPLLRLNISYRRIRRASSANMGALFPRNTVSSWRAEIIEPLAKMTALVIELNSHPKSQSSLRLFLSPFFFKDKSPHFVILVDDWMRFSAELESMRTGTGSAPGQQQKRSTNSILSRLPGKNK